MSCHLATYIAPILPDIAQIHNRRSANQTDVKRTEKSTSDRFVADDDSFMSASDEFEGSERGSPLRKNGPKRRGGTVPGKTPSPLVFIVFTRPTGSSSPHCPTAAVVEGLVGSVAAGVTCAAVGDGLFGLVWRRRETKR